MADIRTASLLLFLSTLILTPVANGEAQKLESKGTPDQIQEMMQKDQRRRDAERDKQEKKDRIEADAREKAFKKQERLEQEQKDNEERASDKAMSDYIAAKMKEFAGDKSLVTIKPGSKLCVFPDTGMGYLFVEDVDKNSSVPTFSRCALVNE